jgi:ribonuclease D
MLDHLMAQPRVAVDTEANSLYAYYHKVCLIQLSVPGADYLVDPLAFAHLEPLAALFADPGIEKVFHAAENDVLLLKRDHGFHFAHLFDTMIAARILGWPGVGLATLLQEHFGVQLDKRMQRTDWGKRPLTAEQMAYARLDTYYLLSLRDRIHCDLVARRRWDEAQDTFDALPQIEFIEKPFDPEGFWRINNARDLSGRQLAVLREMYLFREECARRVDIPPFKVLNDHVLITLSERQPTNRDLLRSISGLSPIARDRFGADLLQAVRRGQSAPIPTALHRPQNGNARPDEATLVRYEALRAWRVQQAAERGVDTDVILTNETLMRIARENPRSLDDLARLDHLSPWKLQTYGPVLLAILSTSN